MTFQATEPQVALVTKRLRVEVEAEFTLYPPDDADDGGYCETDTRAGIALIEVPADYTSPKPVTKALQFPGQEPFTHTFEPDLAHVIVAQLGWEHHRFTHELLLEPVEVISIKSEEGDLQPNDDQKEWEMRVVSVQEEVASCQ